MLTQLTNPFRPVRCGPHYDFRSPLSLPGNKETGSPNFQAPDNGNRSVHVKVGMGQYVDGGGGGVGRARLEPPPGSLICIRKYLKKYERGPNALDFSSIQPVSDLDVEKKLPHPYRPWQAGKYHMTMGIRKMPEEEWLILDNLYKQEQELRRYLIRTNRNGVMQCLPGAERACEEALEYIVDFLVRRYPAHFQLLKDRPGYIHNNITNRKFKVTAPYDQHPLEVIAQLVMEDINLLLPGTEKEEDSQQYYLFSMAPAGWYIEERIGWPLWRIHGPVPMWEEKLRKAMDRFFLGLKVDSPVQRNNYFMQMNETMFQQDPFPDSMPHTIRPEDIRIRHERQTLRRLPRSRAVLFMVRTYLTPLTDLRDEKGNLYAFRSAIRAWPPIMAKYKDADYFEEAAAGGRRLPSGLFDFVNCLKANNLCKGYENPKDWITTPAGRRQRNRNAARPNNADSQYCFPLSESGEFSPPIPRAYSDGLPHYPSPALEYHGFCHKPQYLGTNWNLPFHSAGNSSASEMMPSPVQIAYGEGVLQNNNANMYQNTSTDLITDEGYVSVQRMANFPEVYVPAALPIFPIRGVDSNVRVRMFYHFTDVLSDLLTTSNSNNNPMKTALVPLALADRNVMDALLCLAGLHLSKVQPGPDVELTNETHQLHQTSLQNHPNRVAAFRAGDATPYTHGVPGQDILFATSTLLWLYELCEGSGDDSWRKHLDQAREVLIAGARRAGRLPNHDIADAIVTDVDPFLLEFFTYHETIATVTSPSSSSKPRFQTNTASLHHDPFMNGVQDGLSEFMGRIASLRSQAVATVQPDGNVICSAVSIRKDLMNWTPSINFSRECGLATQFYQRALFVWLFSIAFPDDKADSQMQAIVQQTIAGMMKIRSGDGVMAYLLFPLFVIGTAAIQAEDRAAILSQFQKLREWSSLGNIDLSQQLVEEMWADHDNGLPSWDWVKHLETHGKSLLVT
ncbi:hypothetical protein G7Y89_g4518 [Cudoniella acicularis]|uniref:Uncharacterized protein n=1 Tax=Cudoniella acicularis TaxID=354080 RepID=A0A8H4RQJ5_9HELO|nr:hypothetical protein G7Y89_g4518 [Cudoniella acicularis]